MTEKRGEVTSPQETKKQGEAQGQLEFKKHEDSQDQASFEKQAGTEKPVDIEKQAENKELAEAKKQAEVEMKTEVEKQAETDKQPEAEKHPEDEKQPHAEDHAEAKKQTKPQVKTEEPKAKTAESKAQAEDSGQPETKKETDVKTRAAAKAQAAAKAKATRARPRKKAKKEEKPLEPSPKQPVLDAYITRLKDTFGADVVEEAWINRPNSHLPTLRIQREKWAEIAQFLKSDASFAFNYLKDLTAYDEKDHMSVVVHLYSFSRDELIAIHVHTERDPAWVPSVTPIWTGANWHEREVYDLFGIDFKGHPNMKRIMMPDDWVGHPLRKDYEPLDEEV